MRDPKQGPATRTKGSDETDLFIGARLRFWRRILNVDSKQLAKNLNITYQQLQKYEKGINRISASRLYKISQELHIPVSYFYQDMDLIVQSAPGSEMKEVLNKRMSAIEFMATEVAMELCRSFIAIRSLYTKEAILRLTVSIAARDRVRQPHG